MDAGGCGGDMHSLHGEPEVLVLMDVKAVTRGQQMEGGGDAV